MSDKVKVISAFDGRCGIDNSDLHISRRWPARGSHVMLDRNIVEELMYDDAFKNMVEDGTLYIEDFELKKELGIEPEDAKTPTIVYLGDEAFIGGDVILFRQQNNNSTFLSYALNSQYAKDYRYKESKGEIIVHIYASSLKRLFLALPPIEEQIKVVKYLDGQINAIDSEIDVINNQISLLQERKQIVINEVVTGKVKVM